MVSDAWATRSGLTAILITVPNLPEVALWREGLDDGVWRQFGAVSLGA